MIFEAFEIKASVSMIVCSERNTVSCVYANGVVSQPLTNVVRWPRAKTEAAPENMNKQTPAQPRLSGRKGMRNGPQTNIR